MSSCLSAALRRGVSILCVKKDACENETWYPGGPCIAFFPLPVADPDRPFNCISCEECGNNCSGHYMGYDKLLERFSKQEKLEFAQPPSVVLLQTYNQLKRIPPLFSFVGNSTKNTSASGGGQDVV